MIKTTSPYRPSNGFEGMDFMDRFCERCRRDAAFQAGEGDSCEIAAATMAFDVDDPEYPKEWVTCETLGPRCTAFEPMEDDGKIQDGRQEAMPL